MLGTWTFTLTPVTGNLGAQYFEAVFQSISANTITTDFPPNITGTVDATQLGSLNWRPNTFTTAVALPFKFNSEGTISNNGTITITAQGQTGTYTMAGTRSNTVSTANIHTVQNAAGAITVNGTTADWPSTPLFTDTNTAADTVTGATCLSRHDLSTLTVIKDTTNGNLCFLASFAGTITGDATTNYYFYLDVDRDGQISSSSDRTISVNSGTGQYSIQTGTNTSVVNNVTVGNSGGTIEFCVAPGLLWTSGSSQTVILHGASDKSGTTCDNFKYTGYLKY